MNPQIDRFPDSARVWIYGCEQPIPDQYLGIVNQRITDFSNNWKSHGTRVDGYAFLFEQRFIFFCALDSPSGCSIDSSVAVLKKLYQDTGIDFLNINLIYFRQDSEIRCVSRRTFSALVRTGSVSLTTPVFDLSVERLGDLRRHGFEKLFKKSWHAHAFKSMEAESLMHVSE